jgi:small subunit ribosomal protein S13
MSIFQNLNIENKKLTFALNSVFGIGYSCGRKICNQLGFDSNSLVKDLTSDDLNKINLLINVKYKYIVNNDLNKQIFDNIKNLKNSKTYRGIRPKYRLPVNGQRTHTNSKNARKL